ncbi:MAG: hypothetical protein JNJ71_14970 [Rubrivivax sp.]|nr:hypothetical protein [Rubrivivax sp.]
MTMPLTVKADARSIQDLMTRIDAQFPPGRGRLTGFIASGEDEGTSTLALAYAQAVCSQMRRRVLLLDAGSEQPGGPVAGRASLAGMLAFLSGDRMTASSPGARRADAVGALRADAAGALRAGAAGEPEDERSVWELLPRTDLWYALREQYDEVVIDLPAPSVSRVGLAVAPYCDGVAVVIEAERTRSPVAESLVAHLRSVRARVLGAVLNKRRFHLPAPVYRLL